MDIKTVLLIVFSTVSISLFSKGKIIFSEDSFINSNTHIDSTYFSLYDEIYGKVFLEYPLNYYFLKSGITYDFNDPLNKGKRYNFKISVYVDSGLKGSWLFEMPREAFIGDKTINFCLSSNDEEVKKQSSYFVKKWNYIVSNLDEGSHLVTFRLFPVFSIDSSVNEKSIAEGSFHLHLVKEAVHDFLTRNNLGKPVPTIELPYIEKEILKIEKYLHTQGKLIDAVITDKDRHWSYTIAPNNDVLYRQIVAAVIFKQGDKCVVKHAWFMQEHRGYGQYDRVQFAAWASGYEDYSYRCGD